MVECSPKFAKLVLPTNERNVLPNGASSAVMHRVDEPPRLDRRRLPLRCERFNELERGARAREPFRRRPDQHLTRTCCSFVTLRHVYRIAGDEDVSLARHHLAGVDANAEDRKSVV